MAIRTVSEDFRDLEHGLHVAARELTKLLRAQVYTSEHWQDVRRNLQLQTWLVDAMIALLKP